VAAIETAVLDANVIFRGALRDFLLSVAEWDAFLPAWSEAIHAEWMRNRFQVYGDPSERLANTRDRMEVAFPGACMEPDPTVLADVLSRCVSDGERKDAHVVMTAVVAEATTIVTFDGAHFPPRILDRYKLRSERPDAFCARLCTERIDAFVAGVRAQRARLRRPERDPEEFLRHLAEAIGMTATADLLRPHMRGL